VNKFQQEELGTIPILSIDEQIERDQVARVQAVRQNRNPARAEAALNLLREAANGSENLLPRI
jgi:methylmalonyl-CoA mutase N-terminal domain/subunit